MDRLASDADRYATRPPYIVLRRQL